MAGEVSGSAVVVAAALSQLGKPYAWDTPVSATDPNPDTFDCSGLTMWSYRKAGIKLAHFTGAQYAQLHKRNLSEAMPGDLVFFASGGVIYHVGLYVGDSEIVEAPDYGIPVRRRTIGPSSTDIMRKVGAFPGSQSLTKTRQQVTYRDFFTAVLDRLGYPVTDANLNALATVSIIEGPNDRYNPLNSSVPFDSSVPFNSVGVQDYGNYNAGIGGTVALLHGSPWRDVDSTLQSGYSRDAILSAFSSTYASWGSHPDFGGISQSSASALLDKPIGVSDSMTTFASTHNPPPYPVRWIGTSTLGSDGYAELTINGRVYKVKQGGDLVSGSTHQVPESAYPVMVKWLKSIGDTVSNSTDHKTLLYVYVADAAAYNPKSTYPHSPVENVLGWADSLGKALLWLTNVKNWERIGLFMLGAIILIFAGWEFFK